MQNSYHQIDRIHWIDIARGICIIALVLYHTESYYIDTYHVFQFNWCNNFLKTFFFLSGYLLYKEGKVYDNDFIKYKTKRIVKTLLIPYFIFTIALVIPKYYALHFHIQEALTNIVLGKASWFVSTLILSELLFISILRWSKNSFLTLPITSIIGLVAALILSKCTTYNPWCFQQSLAVFSLLYLGFIYHQYEKRLQNLNWTYILISAGVTMIMLKIIVEKQKLVLNVYPLEINNLFFYIIDAIVGISLIIATSKIIANNKLLEYTGKLSIIIYFLNGGVSVITSNMMNQVGFVYNELYYRVIIMFCMNLLIVLFISHIIYQYLPFIIGLKKQASQ